MRKTTILASVVALGLALAACSTAVGAGERPVAKKVAKTDPADLRAVLVMSDDLANGIIARFPEKFSR